MANHPAPQRQFCQQALPTEATIFLIGVVHGDPQGYTRAWTLLHRLQPRVITVEISRFSLAYRKRQTAVWQQQLETARRELPAQQREHLALTRIAAQIAWPFEAAVAAAYATEAGIPWEPVDLNLLSRRHLPLYSRELLTSANLRALVLTPDGEWEEDIRQQYRQAAKALAQTEAPALPGLTASPYQRLREKILAMRLRRLAKQWGRLVHFGGWEHLKLASSPRTLASYLQKQQPVRLLLCAADPNPEMVPLS